MHCPGCAQRVELETDAETIPVHPRGSPTQAAEFSDNDTAMINVVAIITIDRPCKWSGALITKRESHKR